MTREIDAQVAEKVLGWELTDPGFYRAATPSARFPNGTGNRPIPPYSTDIAAAFDVVEAMRGRGWFLELENGQDGLFIAEFLRWHGHCSPVSGESAAPAAICEAALAAVEGEG